MGYKSMALRRTFKMGAMSMRRTRRRDSGFSMIEIMIAMGVIAVALFAVLSMTMHTNTTREDIREMEVAKEAAFRKIDELRSLPWGLTTSPPTPPTVVKNYVTAVRTPEIVQGLQYNVSTAVDPWNTLVNNPNKLGKLTVVIHGVHHSGAGVVVVDPVRLVDIEVLVQWTGVKGQSHYSTRIMLTKAQQGN
jgi:prepilin-type N-terminal cleavage/methylation domain-containing protein